ncbi:MAG: AEC family transporter [Clostridia bacterium]
MNRYIYSLGLIAFGLIFGQAIRALVNKEIIKPSVPTDKYIKTIQSIALLGLNPIITLGAFWAVRINDIRLIALPILGISSLALGGILGLIASRALHLSRKQTGSMFVTGSFSNTSSFGGLICYVFLGETSYAFVSMYRLFEEFMFYVIGFPIAKLYGDKDKTDDSRRKSLIKLILDPYIMASFFSIIIGSSLNLSGIARLEAYKMLNDILIPLTSLLLVISVGYNMRVSAVGGYLRECLAIASIKFLFVPVFITGIAYLLGIQAAYNGLIFKVIMILSSMPPAFNALIPPQIYNLDKDLANSCWLFGTGALVITLPILFMVQRFL